ncbi:MAG: tRNA uridine-5-carboxymethylaminomethyl(34) synthesis GTPase MnmE [Verrucomicrobia bacterium]|nr:tRNA uridine-5-carboxymethylaminomethyl(34) synthesis GTPase MnmE [Verrucomicrobiota bacterium]
MFLDDTIAAIATAAGEAGLALIRISGPQALTVADRCFAPAGRHSAKPTAAPTHTIHYGKIVQADHVIDEVLLSVMRAPRTFTREDVAEITCHGGLLTTKLVLDVVLANGARLAEPGEFTRRAFLNGRIDLAQAEAVSDLIHSRTELSLAAANEQLAGKLSQRINQLRDQLLSVLAHVEAQLDFPEEDIAPHTLEQLLAHLENAVRFMDQLLRTAREGQILRRGVRAAIVGRPNVGKSSLLNHLLGHERAIVSPIAGTTRDTIEETANIRGLPVVFIDTAGLRESEDSIEREGVRRSHAALERAELILHVLDGAEPLSEADRKYLSEFANRKRIIVRNKTDLPPRLELPPDTNGSLVTVSCATAEGLEELKDAIKDAVWSGAIVAESFEVMINSRHQDALRRTHEATSRTIEALRTNIPLDLAALDLRVAVNAVGEIVGQTTTEDLLDSIFKQFCLGK